jgi:hypothetical protein
MAKATTIQIRRFYSLLGQKGIREQKDTLISAYGVESTKDLAGWQIEDLIRKLQDGTEKKVETVVATSSLRKERSTVLDLLTKLGVYKDKSSWSDVNRYLALPQIAGKAMYELDEEELKVLQRKLRSILQKQIMSQSQLDYLAKNN